MKPNKFSSQDGPEDFGEPRVPVSKTYFTRPTKAQLIWDLTDTFIVSLLI